MQAGYIDKSFQLSGVCFLIYSVHGREMIDTTSSIFSICGWLFCVSLRTGNPYLLLHLWSVSCIDLFWLTKMIIDIYGHPPPWSTYKHFIWELPVFYAHFFLPEKWHSHVSISFTYYVSCRPRHTHTHMQFCFCLLFCHFLRFWSKTQKTLRKPKKTKLQDPCRYKLVS